MTLSIIAAHDRNRVIGAANDLPWRLPEDWKRFKRITRGHVLVMGRKTYESISRPLPERTILVLTRQKAYRPPGGDSSVRVVSSLASTLEKLGDEEEVFIAGGEQIYRQTLPQADRMYLTHIEAEFDGDAFFPEVDWSEWRTTSRRRGQDERTGIEYVFANYRRRPKTGEEGGEGEKSAGDSPSHS